MRKYKDWREMGELNEFVSAPVTKTTGSVENPAEETPTEEDTAFYNAKISAKLNKTLGWLTTALGVQQLNLVRKGFILEKIIQALGFANPGQAMRVVMNIKRAMQDADRQQPQTQPQTQPAKATVPAPPATVNNAVTSNSGVQMSQAAR